MGDLVDFVSQPRNEYIVQEAEDRIYHCLTDGRITIPPFSDPRDVLIYPTARLIAEAVADSRLIAKQAEAEEKAVNRELGKEDPEFVKDLCRNSLDWQLESTGTISERAEMPLELRPFDLRIRFENYLEVSYTFRDEEWSLVNRFLSQGWILIRRSEIVRMAAAKFAMIIKNGRLDLPPLSGRLTEAVERIRAQLPERAEFKLSGDVQQTVFPPCMQFLYNRLEAGQHLAHTERFTLAAFLNKVKLDRAEIERLFMHAPDAGRTRGRSIVEYQVKHISEKGSKGLEDDDTGYMPLNCSKMMNLGICPVYRGEAFDPLCKYVKNPLSFYHRRAYEVSKGYKPNPDFYAKKYKIQHNF